MQLSSVKRLLIPLVRGGVEWQYIGIDGHGKKPKFYFTGPQIFIIIISFCLIAYLKKGVDKDLIGYIMSAFAISVSLFMSLLVSIFDKFEKTSFDTHNLTETDIARLKLKKNFFKRFISVTSYLVVLSILIIVLCSFNYLKSQDHILLNIQDLTINVKSINWHKTLKCGLAFTYRMLLLYFIMDYLLLTLFVAGSSFEYYISELDKVKISKP